MDVFRSPFLFLHILTMFTIVAFHSGPQILALAAARTGQNGALGPIASLYERTGRTVPPLGILGALLGIATGLTGGFNLLAPWLLIAYALFVLLVVFGGVVSAPYILRIGEAAREDRPNLRELIGPRLTLIVTSDALILVLIIADMVLKPFA
jgi:Predicted integral membrane protein (DUF2269)